MIILAITIMAPEGAGPRAAERRARPPPGRQALGI